MGISTSYTFIMQTIILVTLVSAAYSLPQIVPYVHEEIAAEPYIHQEVEAEPYVHIEPEISPLALGIVRPNAAPAAPQQFAAPVQQQQFVPQQQFCTPAVCSATVCPSSSSCPSMDRRLLQQPGRGSSLQTEVLSMV